MCQAYGFSLNPGGKEKRFQLTLNNTVAPLPTTLHPTTMKSPPKNKNIQNNIFFLPLIGLPHKIHNIKIEKQVSMQRTKES